MRQGTTIFLKLAIFILGIIILSLCVFLLPELANVAAKKNPEYAFLRFPILVGLYLTAIPFYLALYQGLKLLHFIEKKNAFSDIAVTSLGHIKICAITIFILYVIGIIVLVSQNALHPGIALSGAVIIFATLVISFFAAVLQELLRNALDIKEENDLTV
ncbi:DUF2975 domain-containing protein [Heyndrickxia vini]|uniref:DUF2975 domain-containing protein n=1 Tax=Heyndrickxia vini TaxID=1476025 RepID=A0ABX7E2G9_9BACI|nr:DUF2975 domain-containing protein [Heyndrickxia vini]QQZ09916.1 DUF2975 domain-containing protein [Heyndrickxia vini]